MLLCSLPGTAPHSEISIMQASCSYPFHSIALASVQGLPGYAMPKLMGILDADLMHDIIRATLGGLPTASRATSLNGYPLLDCAPRFLANTHIRTLL